MKGIAVCEEYEKVTLSRIFPILTFLEVNMFLVLVLFFCEGGVRKKQSLNFEPFHPFNDSISIYWAPSWCQALC